MSTTAKQAGKDDDYAKKSDVEDLHNEMNGRFEHVNERLGRVEDSLKAVNERLDDLSEESGKNHDLLVEINRKL